MFSSGVILTLFFLVILGLIILRILESRPSPNAELIAGLLESLSEPARKDENSAKPVNPDAKNV